MAAFLTYALRSTILIVVVVSGKCSGSQAEPRVFVVLVQSFITTSCRYKSVTFLPLHVVAQRCVVQLAFTVTVHLGNNST